MLEVRWADHVLHLLPERALHLPAQRAAIIADVHLGKAATFRAAGIPVPEAATAATLARMDRVVERTACTRLVVLGDLLHARSGQSAAVIDAVAAWRQRHRRLACTLVRGNHDRSAGDPPRAWEIECVEGGVQLGDFTLRHEPGAGAPSGPTLCGHLHPAVRLYDASAGTLRLPCFHFQPRVAILPAFGDFTGARCVRPSAADRVFVVGPDEVVELPFSMRVA